MPFIKDHTVCALKRDIIIQSLRGTEIEPTSNPTSIPDDIFKDLTPVILIRHPALVVPSYYRAQKPVFRENADDEDFIIFSSLKWARILFEACRQSQLEKRPGANCHPADPFSLPIIIDAEDIIYNTEITISNFCGIIRIDEKDVQYSWPAVPEQEQPKDPIMQAFFRDLFASTGVMRGEKVRNGITHRCVLYD